MSIELANSTCPSVSSVIPKKILVKTGSGFDHVFFGDYEVDLNDFLLAAHYVLTNKDLDLRGDDPRTKFVRCVAAMQEVPGFNTGRTRLESPFHPLGP